VHDAVSHEIDLAETKVAQFNLICGGPGCYQPFENIAHNASRETCLQQHKHHPVMRLVVKLLYLFEVA
jgi:hypothetical protein